MHLLLQGFMGTGKSTVGRLVAERAGAPFVDLDEAVVERAGRSIPDIFAMEGEATFRRLEAAALHTALAASPPTVIALGGGALLDRSLRRRVLARARVVTLAARAETIAARTAQAGRPLLDDAPSRLDRIGDLLVARADAYAEAHAQILTDDLAPAEVASRVLAAWARPAIAVALGTRSYVVRAGARELHHVAEAGEARRPSATFVITDDNVERHHGGALASALAARGLSPRATAVLPPGEEHKQLATVERALAAMVAAGADRDAVVVAHGGGVVTDMGGLAAALLLRGVRWVAVPTTLLAMVDASVGGKTGVDVGAAKNAIGAFHQPSAVIIDAAHVNTETERGFTSGLAEVVKSAAIGDAELFDSLESDPAGVLAREPSVVQRLVLRSVAVKAAIVARDEHESGERALLNFGHTVGHALESEGGYTRLTHGEAVALGMVASLRIGIALGLTDRALAERITTALDHLHLPTDLDAQPLAAALPRVSLDKKRRRGAIQFVLLRALGDALVHPIDPEDLPALLRS